jgi:nicotinamidase-related amidase
MKLSQTKTTFPGRKQVYRVYNAKGKFSKDIMALEGEKIKGTPLLIEVMRKGKAIYSKPTLTRIREFAKRNLAALDAKYKRLVRPAKYPVIISQRLKNLTKDLASEIRRRQNEGHTPEQQKGCPPIGKKGVPDMGGIVFLDIDTQFDFIDPAGKLYVSQAEKLIPNFRRLFNLAKKHNIPIVSSLDTHRSNDPEFKDFPPHCIKGTKGYKKIKQTIGTNQILVVKHTIDTFSNPRIKAILKPYQNAYVFGVALDYCVRAACLGLVNSGIKTYLITDATKAVSSKGKTQTISLLKQKGVIFIKTKGLIERLSRVNY